jgi:hypothetical protein
LHCVFETSPNTNRSILITGCQKLLPLNVKPKLKEIRTTNVKKDF